ncbi:MAG: hypothetical protein K1Y36_15530 [Blastocatellia bacterium]|nr:hypothetical protein [Blastocatellia bacterium]
MPGNKTRPSFDFLEFVVDGRSLRNLLGTTSRAGCLGWLLPKVNRRYAQELLLRKPSELRSNRYVLYVCAECADLGCGAVTVHLEKEQEAIIWHSFYLEDGSRSQEATVYEGVGPFRFRRSDYVTALAGAVVG